VAPRVVTYLETTPGSDELRVVHLDQHATAEQIRRAAGGGTVGAGSLLGELKSVIGFSIGLVGRTRPDLVTQRRTELWDLLAVGRLNLKYIDLPLGEITKAIDLVATRSNLGRVVLRTR